MAEEKKKTTVRKKVEKQVEEKTVLEEIKEARENVEQVSHYQALDMAITDDLQKEVEETLVDYSELEAHGDMPEEDWPDDVKKEWFTPRVYDENRPYINIGVVCGMKELKYTEVKKQLDIVLWSLPPWQYKHRIHCVDYSLNYWSVKRYAEARKKEFQTCPIYYKFGPRARIIAFEHLVRQIRGGVLLILKDKEDGAIAKLMQMANAFGVKIVTVEY